ncbi:hypothetical protein ANTPLA_LOCUS7866 [Anthophora plagiata]
MNSVSMLFTILRVKRASERARAHDPIGHRTTLNEIVNEQLSRSYPHTDYPPGRNSTMGHVEVTHVPLLFFHHLLAMESIRTS